MQVAVPTIFHQLEVPNSTGVVANTQHSVAVPTTRLLPEDPITKVADVSTPSTVVARTDSPRQADRISRVVLATHTNSVAVRTVLPPQRGLKIKVAVAKIPSLNAVPMKGHRPKDQTLLAAPAMRLNTDAVLMVLRKRREKTLKVALVYRATLVPLVDCRKIVDLAEISPSTGSMIPTTVAVRDSGMEAAMVTVTDSRHRKNAKMFAFSRKEKTFVNCRKYRDHVRDTSQNGTTIAKENNADSSSIVDVSGMPINLKRRISVTNSVFRLPMLVRILNIIIFTLLLSTI